jgi:predicted TIM-barrel fold metal-dependent hydrolase
LFGTETPGRGTFTVSGRLLDDLVPVVRGLPISEEEKRWILEANARKVFKLG